MIKTVRELLENLIAEGDIDPRPNDDVILLRIWPPPAIALVRNDADVLLKVKMNWHTLGRGEGSQDMYVGFHPPAGGGNGVLVISQRY